MRRRLAEESVLGALQHPPPAAVVSGKAGVSVPPGLDAPEGDVVVRPVDIVEIDFRRVIFDIVLRVHQSGDMTVMRGV